MALRERRPGRRRENLEHFKRGEDGRYAYAGVLLAYRDEKLPRSRFLLLLGILAAVSAAAVLGAGFLPAAGMRKGFAVVLPYILSIALVAVTVLKSGRLLVSRDPIREYVYEETVLMLPVFSVLAAAACGVTVLAELIHVLVRGFEGRAGATVGFLLLELAAGGALLPLRALVKGRNWEPTDKTNE